MYDNIFITGLASVSNIQCEKQDIINNIINKTIPEKNIVLNNNIKSYKADDFTLSDFFDAKKLRRVSKLGKMVLHVIDKAVKDSNIDYKNNSDKIGIFFSTGLGEINTTTQYLDSYIDRGVEFVSPMNFHNSVHNAPSGLAAIEFGIKGPNITVSQKDISFETALSIAANFLNSNRIKYAIVCAADENLPIINTVFEGLGIIKKNRDKNSFIPGEGASAFILEKIDNKKPENAYAKLTYIKTGNIPCLPWEYPKDIKDIELPLEQIEQIDYIFTGVNGLEQKDKLENECFELIKTKNKDIKYWDLKKIIGEFPTSSALLFYLAVLSVKGEIPASSLFKNETDNKSINKIMIQNITCSGSYSFCILDRV